MTAKGPAPKKLTAARVLGERGISLISDIVLQMHAGWHPTNTSLEMGLDGWIEFADPDSEAALGVIAFVQSRATAGRFQRETDESFEYLCSERDLTYWLNVSGPVILVRSRPPDREAYWVNIKGYFDSPERRKSRLVVFNKARDRFDADARHSLLQVAVPRDRGLSSPPIPANETLYTNLLPVRRLPDPLFYGTTTTSERRRVVELLRQAGNNAREWAMHGNYMLSVHDLREPLWSAVVDRGTVEEFGGGEWALADDKERFNLFTELLNRCLAARLRTKGVSYDRHEDRFSFDANHDLSARTTAYRSLRRESRRTVVGAYEYKDPERVGIAYYRHYATHVEWSRFGGRWYVSISPTYRFTSDGHREHPFAQGKLKGIKALENNAAVLAHVVFWADMLRDEEPGLWEAEAYPFLGFEGLLTFPFDFGINDALWADADDNSMPGVEGSDDLLDLGLETSGLAESPAPDQPSPVDPRPVTPQRLKRGSSRSRGG